MACPVGFAWSPTDYVPNASAMSQNTAYPFTVYGTGLYAWYHQAGGNFLYGIVDNNYPSVTWGNYTFGSVVENASGNYDALTFNASETGSSSGASSTITITVVLTNNGARLCPGTWNQAVKYA
jgi:hypothetical protein